MSDEIDLSGLDDDPIRRRLLGKGDLEDLLKALDDKDEEDYKKFQVLRDLASAKYDFTGFDHVNCYNRENFTKGVLEALENTRKRLSISTAEKLIDFLYIFGYSIKRIIYIIFYCGYINWNRRDVQNYINRHKRRLNEERANLMAELDKKIQGVFQNMKENVMKSEEAYLVILLDKAKDLTKEIRSLDVTEDSGLAKFNKLTKVLNGILEKCKGMHGIEDIRKANIEIAKQLEIKRAERSLAQGFEDDVLKLDSENRAKIAIEGSKTGSLAAISKDTKNSVIDME